MMSVVKNRLPLKEIIKKISFFMIPSDSIGRIAVLKLEDIHVKVLRVDHQSLEESDLDLSRSAVVS